MSIPTPYYERAVDNVFELMDENQQLRAIVMAMLVFVDRRPLAAWTFNPAWHRLRSEAEKVLYPKENHA